MKRNYVNVIARFVFLGVGAEHIGLNSIEQSCTSTVSFIFLKLLYTADFVFHFSKLTFLVVICWLHDNGRQFEHSIQTIQFRQVHTSIMYQYVNMYNHKRDSPSNHELTETLLQWPYSLFCALIHGMPFNRPTFTLYCACLFATNEVYSAVIQC